MQTNENLPDSRTASAAEEAQNQRVKLMYSLKSALFILCSSIVIFVAFSNTLTWQLQYFWDAAGDFWQSQWNKVCNWFGSDIYVMRVWGTFLLTFLEYWILGLCFTFIDLTRKPAFVLRYKIQDDTSYPVSLRQVLKVVQQGLFNHIVVGIPCGIFLYYMMEWRGYNSDKTLPTFQRILLELIICIITEEIALYYSHRLLHHPRIYKHFHKSHHEWTSPIAITAIYCHPVDFAVTNLSPTLLGPIILGSHIATIWLWYSIVIFYALSVHSGFHFPFFPSSEAHDFHHLKFNENFGVLGVLDRLHGTDSLFRSSKMYERHTVLLSLAPLKQL